MADVTRDGSGRWVAGGGSPNPAGRPTMPAEIRQALEAATPKALARLIELLDSDDERTVLVAAKELMDRAYGKAPAAVTVDAVAETQRHLEAYGEEVRIEVLRILRSKHADDD